MATRMTGQSARRSLRVFYRDYANRVSILSSAPESLSTDRIVPLAERLLSASDNFLGIVDRSDTILQCYVDNDDSDVTVELIYPEANGCLRTQLPRAAALAMLDKLPESFDDLQLDGAQYID
jgi:hypothetical protein